MELWKKLRLKEEVPIWLVGIPEDCLYLFDGLDIGKPRQKPAAQVIVFATDSVLLGKQMKKLDGYILPSTLLWICYPKKSGKIQSDLARMKDMSAWEIVFGSGFRPQTSISVNEDWTALRFTNAEPKKPSTYNLPPEERHIEGIDFINRTVQLPADAATTMQEYAGMAAFFNAMSFTHKKEYAQSIAEAKKPETRQKRINKMIDMLAEKMLAKTAKKRQG